METVTRKCTTKSIEGKIRLKQGKPLSYPVTQPRRAESHTMAIERMFVLFFGALLLY